MAAETDEERFAALQWAASFRGASDHNEALDWMMQRGLVEQAEGDGEVRLTAEGVVRADALYDALLRVPQARRARRRTLWLALAGVGLYLWRRRSADSSGAR